MWIFDSRPNESDGAVHITKQRYGGAAIISVRVGDVPGVPATASAVSLNVTATEPLGDGFVTVFPCGDRTTRLPHRGPPETAWVS